MVLGGYWDVLLTGKMLRDPLPFVAIIPLQLFF